MYPPNRTGTASFTAPHASPSGALQHIRAAGRTRCSRPSARKPDAPRSARGRRSPAASAPVAMPSHVRTPSSAAAAWNRDTRFRNHACVHSARYHTRRLPMEAAVGRHGSGTGWFDRRRALDRRRRKATELALDEPGKSNRTAIVQVRTDDLHPDREAVLASTVGHCRRG